MNYHSGSFARKVFLLAVVELIANLVYLSWRAGSVSVFFVLTGVVLLGAVGLYMADPHPKNLRFLALLTGLDLVGTILFGAYKTPWNAAMAWPFTSNNHFVILTAAVVLLPILAGCWFIEMDARKLGSVVVHRR